MSHPERVDLIMWAGEQYYTVTSFTEEAERLGVSKRIGRLSIPEGIVPGESRILIKHRRAIIRGNVRDLVEHMNIARAAPEYDSERDMLQVVMMMERLQENDPEYHQELTKRYGLTWHPGVIGYSYITGVQYVVKDGEGSIPDDLAHIEGIEAVRLGENEG